LNCHLAYGTTVAEKTAMKQELGEDDVRSMIRLVGEVAALEGEHAAKKRYLMDGLCVLIDAEIWLWGLSCQTVPGAPQVYVNFTAGGMSDEQFPRLLKAIGHPDMFWVVAGFFKELSEKRPI